MLVHGHKEQECVTTNATVLSRPYGSIAASDIIPHLGSCSLCRPTGRQVGSGMLLRALSRRISAYASLPHPKIIRKQVSEK